MRKDEFLLMLQKRLEGLPKYEIEERLTFYSEMIDDRMEEGVNEEDAVSMVGDVDKIVEEIISLTPISKIAKERSKPQRRLKAFEIVLIVLGSPIWLSVFIASISVIFSIYVSLWAVIISLWAIFVSFIASGSGGLLAMSFQFVNGNTISGIAMLGSSMVLLGLSIFTYYCCKAASRGIIALTRVSFNSLKRCFIRKKEV